MRNEISGSVHCHAVIQGRDVTMALPREVPSALSGLPAGSRGFTGRDAELNTLLGGLDPASGGPAVTAVAGLPGVGKTELVVQAAHAARARGWCPGGVVFVDLHGYDPQRRIEPAEALDGLLRALGVAAEHIPVEAQDRARLYASVLAAFAEQDRSVLVVLDNAAGSDQVRPLLPGDGVTATIVTSRHTLPTLDARLLDLNVLTEPAAVDLITRALRTARGADTRITDAPAEALRIARCCGLLPLALRIVAAQLAENPHRPLAALAGDLEDERARLDELAIEDRAVRTAFDLSYRNLPAESATLFPLLALNPGPDLSTGAAAALAGADERTTRRTLEDLARAHLVDPAPVYGRWRLHDLVRLFAAELPKNGDEDALDRLLDHYGGTAQDAAGHVSADAKPRPVSGFANRQEALAWLDAERANLVTACGLAERTGRHVHAVTLPLTISMFLSWRRHLHDAVAVLTPVLVAAREQGEWRIEAHVLHLLGHSFNLARRFPDAVDASRRAAEIFGAHGADAEQGHALDTLGAALGRAGRLAEAVDIHRRAEAIARRIGRREDEAQALTNAGTALAQLSRVAEAADVLHRALAIHRELGSRHNEGATLNSIGSVLRDAGHVDDAVEAFRRALDICHELDDRHSAATTLTNLGVALIRSGRPADAAETVRPAIEIYHRLGDRYAEAQASEIVAAALAAAGRFAAARVRYGQARELFAEVGAHDRVARIDETNAALP